MNLGRTVFSQLIEHLPSKEFHKCVLRYRGDSYLKSFSCWDQFLSMAFAQLTYRESLRDIETCLRSMHGKLYHMGFGGRVARSTLADANESRDWRIYADFAQVLIGMARPLYAHDPIGVDLDQTLYALDSTTIDLCLSLFPWARFRKHKAAVKMHTLLDLHGNIPTFIRITADQVHDVNILDEFLPEAGAFYVMDRGYVDFRRLFVFTLCSAFFVVRTKKNVLLQRRYSHPVDRSTGLRSDHTVILGDYKLYLTNPAEFETMGVMKTKHKAPGKSHRQGVDLFQIIALFPDDVIAERWFEETLWGAERCCGHCGSVTTSEVPKRKPMPYWCKDCRSYFSVRTGTAIARSNVPLRKWAIAIYLCLTSLKSVSSMKLHRDIKVSQRTAWFMLHRIREAWAQEPEELFDGPVEADESFFGGRRANMPRSRRKQLKGRGVAGKVAVAGVKDRTSNQVRARVVENTDSETLQEFVRDSVKPGATLYTDDAMAYDGMKDYDHESVKHSVAEYVRGMVHTNGIESFWSMLKRAHKGTFHKLSPKHLDRYVREFAGRHNIRQLGTLAQMRDTVARLVGRNLLYRDLVRDNGLPSGSRS